VQACAAIALPDDDLWNQRHLRVASGNGAGASFVITIALCRILIEASNAECVPRIFCDSSGHTST
jgi:hypothetical protein